MARWLVVLVVLLGGALLVDQWFGDTGASGPESLKASVGEPTPAVADRGVDPSAALAKQGADRSPGRARTAPRPALMPEANHRQVDQIASQAQNLLASGQRAEAVSLLRDAWQAAKAPAERGRLGLKLAMLLPGAPATQRQFLAEALATRQVLGAQYEQVGGMLRELNRSHPSSLIESMRTASYTVQPNDSLWKLCHRDFPDEYGVQLEVGLIKLVNGLSNDTLRVGQVLTIPLETLRLEVDRQQRGLTAWVGEVPVMAFRIGLGKDGSTPSGDFRIQVKQENPAWTYRNETIPFGDERNILGTRWLGFEDHPGVTGYGIHGTTKPETIGLDESMGCVRMRNPEVEELFEVVPRGTMVSIP